MASALALSAPPTPRLSSAAQEQWLTRSRFLALAKRTDQWLSSQIRSGAVRTRETNRHLRNGRIEIEFAASSLPADAQMRHQAEQRRQTPAQPATLDLFSPIHLAINQPRRIATRPHRRSEADARMDVLQPILQYRQHVRSGFSGSIHLTLADGRPVNSLDRMVQFQAEQHSVSGGTLYRWLRRYEGGGIHELAKKRRADANQSRWFTEHPEAAALVASLHLGDGFFPGLSVQACCNMLRVQRDLVGVAETDLPDRTTVGPSSAPHQPT